MKIIFVVILLALAILLGLLAAQHRIVLVPEVEAVAASCPIGYEPSQGIEGYIWTPCFEYQGVDGCYGIRDDGMTNSVISCPQACCDEELGLGQWVEVR